MLGVSETMRLPHRAISAQAVASCVNGVLSFSVPLTPEVEADVTVAAEKAPEESSDLHLIETAVPGLCAADIKVHLRGRSLSITSTKAPLGARPLTSTLRLPSSVEGGDQLRASCLHGLLTITAAVPKPERRTVSLNTAPPPPPAVDQMAE